MKSTCLALPALLIALTLVLVAGCGEKDEPVKPDVPDQPVKEAGATPEPEAATPPAEEAPKPKLWTLNAENLKGYGAAFKDLRENAPKVLEDAAANALMMAKSNDGLTFKGKGLAVLEKHGLTEEQFKSFGDKLWPAVVAVAPEKASEASGLGALAGDHAKSLEGAADDALKELTKGVTAEDKAFVKDHLDEILGFLK
ncbi:MAG: hypothetical protein ABFS86_10375 [Planctomycetota bacterium]